MRMRFRIFALAVFFASPAAAEVVSSGPTGLHVRETLQIVVPTDRAYGSFSRVGDWWDPQHTYSADSANLSLSLVPGGCFCERLKDGGGVEHMRVAYVDPGKRIVMTGALGPLLYQATTGVMDVQFERIAGGTKVTLDYRAAGFAEGGGDKLAPLVDSVLAEQMTRYRAFARSQPRNP
jgi:uncharacterized protein YndB with AHSA1/START domain